MRLRRLRRVALLVVVPVFVLAGLYGGCRLKVELEPTASISITATRDGTKLRVDGVTDLPEGAVVTVRALHADAWFAALMSMPDTPDPPEHPIPYDVSRDVTITSARYGSEFDLLGWPPGNVLVTTDFYPGYGPQPPSTVERFGPIGERLRGPDVIRDSDGYWYLQTGVSVELP